MFYNIKCVNSLGNKSVYIKCSGNHARVHFFSGTKSNSSDLRMSLFENFFFVTVENKAQRLSQTVLLHPETRVSENKMCH